MGLFQIQDLSVKKNYGGILQLLEIMILYCLYMPCTKKSITSNPFRSQVS